MDSSGSIRDNNPDDGSYDNWSLLLQFIANFAQALDIRSSVVNVGLVQYSNDAHTVFYLNSYMNKEDVINEILGVRTDNQDYWCVLLERCHRISLAIHTNTHNESLFSVQLEHLVP